MANHKSSEKRILQTEKRTERNRARKSKIKTMTKKVDVALESKDKAATATALKNAARELQRAVGKGTLSKNAVARKVSRLTKRVNKASV